MLKTEMKTAIDRHSHCVRGIRHEFRLQWAALEPRWSSRAARYLLAIEVLPESRTGSSTLHIVTRAGTTRADLLRLVDDALEERLGQQASLACHGVDCVSSNGEKNQDLDATPDRL